MTPQDGDLLKHCAQFHFYGDLSYFWAAETHETLQLYHFRGTPAIKDAVEALGVPHTEVDVIVVNGRSVDFEYHLQDRDDVAIYPGHYPVAPKALRHLQNRPAGQARFVADVHLGTLARLLRMLGFDVSYRNDYSDREILDLAMREERIILTRDRGLLKRKAVRMGQCVRSFRAEQQIHEVLHRFELYGKIVPFQRCMNCNGMLAIVQKAAILHRLPPITAKFYDEFFQCQSCQQIFWKGTHHQNMIKKMNDLLGSKRL